MTQTYNLPVLMECNLKAAFWNVRGRNSGANRIAVRSMISAAAPSIVCLQETKLAHVSDSIVFDMLRPSFKDYFFLPATGTRGAILLAWRCSTISFSNPLVGEHHVTTLVTLLAGDGHWRQRIGLMTHKCRGSIVALLDN